MDSLYILAASDGEILIEHDWRGRSFRDVATGFAETVLRRGELDSVTSIERYTCYSVRRGDLVYLGVGAREVDAVGALDTLCAVDDALRACLPTTDAQAIRTGAAADSITEVLHAFADEAIPLTTYPDPLKDVVLPKTLLDRLIGAAAGLTGKDGGVLANAVTGATGGAGGLGGVGTGKGMSDVTPWRRQGTKYTANEIFVDVVEEVRCVVNKAGKLVASQISGSVECVSRLSGMPSVTLQLTPPTALQYAAAHPSVNANDKDGLPPARDGKITFVPPDGAFTLLTYTSELATNAANVLPFSMQKMAPAKGAADDTITIVLTTRKGLPDSLVVEIPLPGDLVKEARVRTTAGDAQLETGLGEDAPAKVIWRLGELTKAGTAAAKASRHTLTISGVSEASAAFSYARISTAPVQGATASGVKVESLKMTRVGDWKPFKGVKYVTKYKDTVFR
ncbi:hypothetical protein PYCC9005_004519 [Savitreella phatthalungensis]